MATSDLGDKKRTMLGMIMWLGMAVIPKNLMSFLVGWLARVRLPAPLGPFLGRIFAKSFKINMAEAELKLSDYKTIEDIFTRRLAPGARSIHSPFCSPVDGTLSESAEAISNTAVQAKGINYSLTELVFGEYPQEALDLAFYTTIYLAPHNYHRVHSPVRGTLTAIRHFSGALWPVNPPFVKIVPRLFDRNERLVFDIELEGGGKLYVVMVGALNVGRMVSPFWPEIETNSFAQQCRPTGDSQKLELSEPVSCGDELGTFMLGSTVVVVCDKTAHQTLELMPFKSGPVVLGQDLLAENKE